MVISHLQVMGAHPPSGRTKEDSHGFPQENPPDAFGDAFGAKFLVESTWTFPGGRFLLRKKGSD